MVHFFNNFLSLSIFSEGFNRSFARFCIAPRNAFNSFVLFGGFNFSIVSTFHSFGFIPFSSLSCPSHSVCFIKNSDFLLLALLFLTYLTRRTIFSHVFVCLRVLRLLCHLASPVYSILVFSLLFLETFWVCRPACKTLLRIGKIR